MDAMERTEVKKISSKEINFAKAMIDQIALIRGFETAAWKLSRTNPPSIQGSMHFCAGQEAVPLGAIAALRDDDQIIATYRGHGWALASGLSPRSVMAELCHRAEGINGGRGGSAYFMQPNGRFIGENSIVGAGTTIACGVAMANRLKKTEAVVVVTIGDGALNQGAVHEAMAFAAASKLGVIFVVENNGWSELTPTTAMFAVDRLARRASGYGIASATLDGSDPFAVRDTFAVAAARARKGEGPSMLEFKVPRLWGHYNKDIEHYRSKADRAAAEAVDPIVLLKARLVSSGIMSEAEVDRIVAEQEEAMTALADDVLAGEVSDTSTASSHVIATPSQTQKPNVTETKEMSYLEAVNAAMRAELESDHRTLVFGEDVGKPGGIFGASRNLQKEFGAERVFDMPIAENAILGTAVGAAISGMKPIAEIMWADFLFVALDQIVNQASNIRYISGGQSHAPMVVRTQQGATPGSTAQHSQCVEALLAHIPGIKVALPSTPQDAYAILRAAAADPDPCVVIESRALYPVKGEVNLTDAGEAVGTARLRKAGKDCVIVSWGPMVNTCVSAAEALADDGLEVSVLDLRWLSPLDEDGLMAAVRNASGRVLIVHEAVRTGGFAGEVAMRISELAPKEPSVIRRLTTPDIRIPASPELQAAVLPNPTAIADAVRAICADS